MHFRVLINFVSTHAILFSSYSLFAQISFPYNTEGTVIVLDNFSLLCFWTLEGFKFL
jgi:hypothetical protein